MGQLIKLWSKTSNMARKNRWRIFVGIAILILVAIILEEAITTNMFTAHITTVEQEKAISIAEEFVADELQNVPQYLRMVEFLR